MIFYSFLKVLSVGMCAPNVGPVRFGQPIRACDDDWLFYFPDNEACLVSVQRMYCVNEIRGKRLTPCLRALTIIGF